MSTRQTIPEWVGSTLTHGAFLDFAERTLNAYTTAGLEAISLTAIGANLTAAVGDLKKAVNRQTAYDETVAVTRADNDRDALAKALWHAWHYLDALSPNNALAPHAETLRSEMNAYKGVWSHEMRKETTEIEGLQAALEGSTACIAALKETGLAKIAGALFEANTACRTAMEKRTNERSSRAEEKAAGTTPELRKAVAALLVQSARRVNAVYEINPENEAAAKAISKVAALVEEYKLVAAEAKHHKSGDDPAPDPEPDPSDDSSDPSGETAAS